ncbi:MAG: transglutaminase domain-containing protein [Anaerolineales bacterium]|nr:transglutaminase domain-containing protein [Anaerolineales bacterium]
MQKPRWWDWPAVLMLFILVQIVSSRLIATNWTPFLYLIRTITFMGCFIGCAVGYSRFETRVIRWLTFLYMLALLPLQLTRVIDQQASLEEQFMSVGGRLMASLGNFFTQKPVEDPIFFVTIMLIAFWGISTWAGYALIRKQDYLGAVLPSTIGLLFIQYYDNAVLSRLWSMALFTFVALLLLGRLNHLQHLVSWQARRVFLPPDSRVDLTSMMLAVTGLIILVSWTIPPSASSLNAAVERWNRMTKPWREFTHNIENAFDAIQATRNGRRVDLFGSELSLGTGFSLSDVIVFNVQPPEIPDEENPPRFYWQGRIYDHYENGQWSATNTTQDKFTPSADSLAVLNTNGQPRFRFTFFAGENPLSLLYAPTQPVWVSRASSIQLLGTKDGEDVSAWFASPILEAGESYQVESAISNPGVNRLKSAGTNYPAWVTDRYLQIPENFSSPVHRLALEITKDAQTPYDKATAITQYLRTQIEYSDSVEKAPENTDSLEWLIFEYKKGYCVYYATAETMMLRSIGIPARMTVGFSQGEYSPETNQYTVRKLNAHAWPQAYFPGIGWVEFEPTGNQPELDRPVEEENNLDPLALTPSGLGNDLPLPEAPKPQEQVVIPEVKPRVSPSLYLIPLFIIFATLTVFLGRRYNLPTRIPTLLRNAYERNGMRTPAWIVNWEQWIKISPIEKAFDSVNFGLRLLQNPMPVYATPIERANGLVKLLPKAENEINTLLDEHQTSLYTSRQADVIRARRAAFNIRVQVISERIRYLIEGNPTETP